MVRNNLWIIYHYNVHCFVSPICPNTAIFTVYNTSKIMHNILREKYFDIVSGG